MIYENGRLLAESERFPAESSARWPTSTSTRCGPSGLRMGTFDDNRRHHQDALNAFRRIDFQLDPPAGDIGLLRQVERFPFVPSDRSGWSRIATRATTSRWPGWSSGCGP